MEIDFLNNFKANVSRFMAKDLKNCKSELSELEKLRKQFVHDFPIDKIPELTLERFTAGNYNRTSFCNRLENQLKGLGNIHGSVVDKFGVYYSNKRSRYECAKKWSKSKDIDEGFINIKNEIVQLLKCGKDMDYVGIHNNRISPLFKGKILSTYYPEKYLSIFSRAYIENFLSALQMEYDYDLTIEQNKLKLLDIKSYDERLKKFDNQLLMKFLYNSIYSYIDNASNIDSVSYSDIELVDMDYLNLIESHGEGIPKKTNHAENQLKRIIQGNKAEDIVLQYEQCKLNNLGKSKLAKRVEQVSKTRGDGLGYDVLSFNENGEEIYIEVKSKRNFQDSIDFYLTENEFTFLDKTPNSYIYYVFDVYSKPKIHIINWEKLKALGENWKVPILYKVALVAAKQ